jgi:hypothetical protein
LDHSGKEDHSSKFDVKKNPVSPEMITLNNGISRDVSIDNGQLTTIGTGVLGIVHEDDVGAVHPESKVRKKKDQLKTETCGAHDPTCP